MSQSSSLFDSIAHAGSLRSLVSLSGIIIATITLRSYWRRRYLPPGPRRYPLLGNALQIPSQFLYTRMTEWSEMYGPIFSFDIFGQPLVVLNTHKAAADLLDRRSAIYSDRPHLVMANEILTDGLVLTIVRYGDSWRRQRRAAHDIFNFKASEKFQHIQARSAIESVLSMLACSEDWNHHVEEFSCTNLLRSVYGWPASANMKSVITRLDEWVVRLAKAATPGSHLVDAFPILKILPSWIAGWKRRGLEHYRKDTEFFVSLTEDVRSRVDAGDARECMAAQLMEKDSHSGLSKKEAAWISGIMFAAGTETTATLLKYFVLAMILNPDVMRTAQAELDSVVGRDRAPNFSDIANLPYIRALVKEVLRCSPTAPLALPHATTEDDWYEGYLIPKGAIVLANTWAMNRDPTFYPEPEVFRPERFLDRSGPAAAVNQYTHDMGHASYGFGRRICVGMHFANQALSIMIATSLWATDIRATVDKDGAPILPKASEYIDKGVVIAPAPFPCEILPRFSEAQAVLEASLSML